MKKPGFYYKISILKTPGFFTNLGLLTRSLQIPIVQVCEKTQVGILGWLAGKPEIDPYMRVKGTTAAVLSGVKGG